MRHDVVMHDIVIRNGTIIDGTNTEPYLGEIAIDGDTIVAVGPPRQRWLLTAVEKSTPTG